PSGRWRRLRAPLRESRRRAGEPRVSESSGGLGLGGLGELLERLGVGHRQLGEDLPVERDPGLLEPGHELGVRQAGHPAPRVDAHDPERPRLALLLLAAAISERPGAEHGLGRCAVELAPAAEVALGLLEDLLATLARLRAAFCPWHGAVPP